MRRNLAVLFFTVIFPGYLNAQGIAGWLDSQKTILYEKVYLHVDRELYSPGDYIRFKSYLVNGITNQPLPGYKNIYIQLADTTGKVYSDRIILSRDGISQGDFLISDSIPDGPFVIRASTKYLENFGEESCFHKQIWILRAKSSLELNLHTDKQDQQIDVSFWPEGGNLVMNAVNYVAFKAVDSNGKGIGVTGKVVDENDSLVAEINTRFQGMGVMMMMPHEQKSYSVRIDNHPEFSYFFNDISYNGVTLHCRDEGDNFLFVISRNYRITENQPLWLVASHKGVVLFYKELTLEGFTEVLKTGKNLFPGGISKITLLDAGFKEIAERLVFKNSDIFCDVQMELNKDEFTTRENAVVSVTVSPEGNDTLKQTLSVVVVNDNYLGFGGMSQTMESYLLLDSELKGPIESPASFFTGDREIPPAEKLDLLMMVNGWRRYYWDELNRYDQEKLTEWNDAGLTVEGYVKSLLKNRAVAGGEVILGPFSRNLLFEETRTDQSGRFRFDRLYLRDSSQIMINAKNEKDRANTEIILDPVFPFQPFLPESFHRIKMPGFVVPMQFYRENYYRQMKLEAFSPDKGSILLKEIEIAGRHVEKDDGHFRIYSNPDNVLKINAEDYTYDNILDYLQGKVAGLVVTGDQISLRGGGMPLFLLDGVKVDESLFSDLILHMRMSDIDKIEVLKSGANMAMFGSQGGNGIIAVYTKKGDISAEYHRYVKGRIVRMVRGYRNPAGFYSPRYTPENIGNPQPDYRPTLYWNPVLQANGGKVKFDFFTSDELSDYSVVVEGITGNGKICFAGKKFRVNGFSERKD